MKKSKLFRTLTLAMAAALCMATTTVTAYAGGADPDPVPLPETTEAPAEVPEETEEPTAYYVDEGADYRQVPEFFAQPEKQLTPDECMTGEQIQTPRGRFYLTDRSREQMEAAGYGFHHQSEDGKYLIMANGTRAFAIPAQPESHIKTAEMSTEQNYNMIDGMMNNAPSMEELEARAKAGEQISLLDVAEAAKAEAKKPKQTRKTTQKQKKPSIRAQLAATKEEQKKRPPAREKSKEMEV